jgi:hypothetical protein
MIEVKREANMSEDPSHPPQAAAKKHPGAVEGFTLLRVPVWWRDSAQGRDLAKWRDPAQN